MTSTIDDLSNSRRSFLPDNHQVLDWMGLAGDSQAAYAFINSLLTTSHAGVTLSPSVEQEERLWHFFSTYRLAKRLRSQTVLYFSYPYFVAEQESHVFAEPLLRWPCILLPPGPGRIGWTLELDQEHPAEVNQYWTAWAKMQHEGDWSEWLSQCLEEGDGLKALANFSLHLTEGTGWETSTLNPAITSFPGAKPLGAMGKAGTLLWGATLGLSSASFLEEITGTGHWRHPILHEDSAIQAESLSHTDSWQFSGLKAMGTNRYTLVNGAKGSGKTHLGIESLKLALLGGKACLVVARDWASLSGFQQHLDDNGLGDLAFTLRQPSTDGALIGNLIKKYESTGSPMGLPTDQEWATELARLTRRHRQLEEVYHASRQRIFGDQSWAELLGYYLSSARIEDKALLANQLSVTQFDFLPKEYQDVMAGIRQMHPLYDKLGSIHHPLSNLNAAIFIHQSEDESQTFIEQTANRLLEKAQPLQQRYIRRQSQYADQLTNFQEAHYRDLQDRWQTLDELLEDGLNELGADMLRSGDRTLKLYGAFSEKFKSAIALRNKITQYYEGLQEVQRNRAAFDFYWPQEKLTKKPVQLKAVLRQFRDALEEWRAALSERNQEELIRLNHKTALAELPISEKIEPLERELEDFIDEVNALGLYQLPLQSKTLTLPRQQKYLEEIIEQLERTLEGLGSYAAYYHWQASWFGLTEQSRKVIAALIKTRPTDWEAAFSSWYFNECLSANYRPVSPVTLDRDAEYRTVGNHLRLHFNAYVHQQSDKRRLAAAGRLRSWARTQDGRRSMFEAFDKVGRDLTQFSPIWLTTPEVAASIVDHFDWVVIDDAQGLQRPMLGRLLSKAKQAVVLSDPDEEGIDASHISPWLISGDIPHFELQQIYLPSFLERQFDQGERVRYIQLDGRYDEAKGTNEAEALEVVKLLNEVKPTPQRTYPKVGVVAMTYGQRNLILKLFYDIKSKRQAGFDTIQQLERNGLEVFHYSEIIGQSFDQLILTGAYGPVDIEGHMTTHMTHLNSDENVAGLTVLQNTSYRKGVIISSLPEDELLARINWMDRVGEMYLSRNFLVAKWAFEGKERELLELREQWKAAQEVVEYSDSLARELSYRLGQLLPEWQWQFKPSRVVPIAVLHAQAPNGREVVLVPDGFLAQSPHTHPAWEQMIAERMGLLNYRVLPFSVDQLWKDPARTCLRLVQQLEGAAEEEE